MHKKYLDQYDDGNPNEDEGLTDKQISELTALVGEIIFSFNQLESNLEALIAEAVNGRSHQPGYIVVAELTPIFTKKVSVFKAMYGTFVESLNNTELKELFPKIVGKLYKIKDVRNEVTHANWLRASQKYEVRLKISNDEKGSYAVRKIITPSDLKHRISEIDELLELIERFEELYGNGL